MAPAIFTINPEESTENKSQVHLLPCRIQHDGDVDASEVYWNPSRDKDGVNTAYLRGRKLHGKAVKLPEGYYGAVVVVQKSAPEPEEAKRDDLADDDDLGMQEDAEGAEDDGDQLVVGAMQGRSTFDEVMVWGHESTADSSSDPYVRSMEEWVTFAERIHSYPTESEAAAT